MHYMYTTLEAQVDEPYASNKDGLIAVGGRHVNIGSLCDSFGFLRQKIMTP